MPSVAIIGTRGYPSYYGGFETAVRHVAPFLAQRGWDVTVYGRRKTVRLDDAGRDHRVTSVFTPGVESKSLSTLSFGFTSSVHAIASKHDVALVMNVANGFWLPMLRVAGIRTLVNVDGIEWDRAKWGKLAKAVFKLGAKVTARFGTKLVFDAQAIGDRWRKDFGRDGVVIPYGGTVAAVEHEAPLNLPQGGYVLVVARFVPENTIEEFFAAVPKIVERAPVVIVGSSGYGGEMDDRARALSEQYSTVTWLGHVSDDALLESLWQNAGAYFHGHSVGGTNPALVQAMALGAPTVARDTPYNREVLGQLGTYVRPYPGDIANALVEMVSSTPASLRENLIDRARSHYDWQDVCLAYESALRQLLPAKKARNSVI